MGPELILRATTPLNASETEVRDRRECLGVVYKGWWNVKRPGGIRGDHWVWSVIGVPTQQTLLSSKISGSLGMDHREGICGLFTILGKY